MKKELFLLLWLLVGQIANAQSETLGPQVILDYDYGDYIDVFYHDYNYYYPFAKVRNNLEKEVILLVTIKERTDDYFLVDISEPWLTEKPFKLSEVYIRKEHLVILSRLLEHPMPLYNEPSKNSAVVINIPNSYGYEYWVLDCDGMWLKVEYTDENKKRHVGWMAPEYQCSNAYSACMGM